MNKTQRAQRIAFGKLLVQGFLLIQSVAGASSNYHIFGLPSKFMSEKELEHLRKVIGKVHQDADRLRDFGNYLQKSGRDAT